MLTRAAVLERFGLLDREAFDICSENQLYGIWMILFGHEGDPPKLMLQETASRLSDEIRGIDPDLADQIDACVKDARRYTEDDI